jgi:hypothetical protein
MLTTILAKTPKRVATAAFSPDQVSGLTLWLKADGTIWQDSARTTAAVADADPVGSWDDASTSGKHAQQATSSKRGTYKTGIQNGLPVIRFDGSDDWAATAAFAAAVTQPYTLFLAFKKRATAFSVVCDGIVSSAICQVYPSGANLVCNLGSADRTLMAADTSFHVLSLVGNGASSKRRVDGGSEATLSASPGTNSLTGFTVAALYNGTFTGDVDFGEVLLYTGELADADKTSVFTYLQRWGTF